MTVSIEPEKTQIIDLVEEEAEVFEDFEDSSITFGNAKLISFEDWELGEGSSSKMTEEEIRRASTIAERVSRKIAEQRKKAEAEKEKEKERKEKEKELMEKAKDKEKKDKEEKKKTSSAKPPKTPKKGG